MTSGNECKFLELTINGLSDHCKVALNKYLGDTKPSLCFLNETRTFVEKNTFDNYSAECSHDDRGVAIMMLENISYTRIVELKIREFDSAWIIVLLKVVEMLATTEYFPPNSVTLLEIWLSELRKAHEYVEAHNPEGLLFLGDLNARHANWNDSTANAHGVLLGEKLDSSL